MFYVVNGICQKQGNLCSATTEQPVIKCPSCLLSKASIFIFLNIEKSKINDSCQTTTKNLIFNNA